MASENEQSRVLGVDFACYLELRPVQEPVTLGDQPLPDPEADPDAYLDLLISSGQRDAYHKFLGELLGSDLKDFRMRATDLGHLGVSNVVSGYDREDAVRTTIGGLIEGLPHAGMNVDDYAFIAAHVALNSQLFEDGQAVQTATPRRPWSISRMQYMMRPDEAEDIFAEMLRASREFDFDGQWAEISDLPEFDLTI